MVVSGYNVVFHWLYAIFTLLLNIIRRMLNRDALTWNICVITYLVLWWVEYIDLHWNMYVLNWCGSMHVINTTIYTNIISQLRIRFILHTVRLLRSLLTLLNLICDCILRRKRDFTLRKNGNYLELWCGSVHICIYFTISAFM